VHDLVVGLGKDRVKAAAQLLFGLLRLIRADSPDDCVHGVVGASGIDCDPAHSAVQDPLGEGACRTRVTDEVLRLVDLRFVGPVLRVVAVVAGVDHQDVTALDEQPGVLLPTFEMLWPIQVVVAEAHALEIDHARRADEEVKPQVPDELAARQEMRGRVEMSADVQRHRDFLATCFIKCEPLDPPDRGTGITGEGRSVQREILCEVEKFHVTALRD